MCVISFPLAWYVSKVDPKLHLYWNLYSQDSGCIKRKLVLGVGQTLLSFMEVMASNVINGTNRKKKKEKKQINFHGLSL